MKSKNLLKIAAFAVALSTGFVSCSSDDDADTTTVTGSQAATGRTVRLSFSEPLMSTPSTPTQTHGQ